MSQLQSFWQRRRRQILIGLAVAGAGVAAGTLIYYSYWNNGSSRDEGKDDKHKSLTEFGGVLSKATHEEYPEEEENQDDEQLRLHFDKIQTIADTTTLPAVLPHLRSRLLSLLDTTPLTTALSAASSAGQSATSERPTSPQEKLRLWEELCVVSFCRSLGAALSLSMLGLFVRAQLNVLGRRVFLDAASAGEDPNCCCVKRGSVLQLAGGMHLVTSLELLW